MEPPTGIIDKHRDYKYEGKDADNFLRCCGCRCYTPFLFYIVSKLALETIHIDPRHNFFCAECVPKPVSEERMYPEGSLLRNDEFLRLFQGYRYSNPYYKKYAKMNRLIITEKSKVHPSFKRIYKKPMPTEAKLDKIFSLFLPVHQLAFEKYSTQRDAYMAIRMKYREIIRTYDETNESRQFYDNIDVLIERTPLVSQQARNRSRHNETNIIASFSTDSLYMRSGSSTEEDTSTNLTLGISMEERGGDTQMPESQRSEQHPASSLKNTESQQSIIGGINISSQDASNQTVGSINEAIAKLTPNSSMNSSSSFMPAAPTHTHTGDSEEAGPSGLQRNQKQQRQPEDAGSYPKPKRQRRVASKPMNPSPQEVQSSRNHHVRMPRLEGG